MLRYVFALAVAVAIAVMEIAALLIVCACKPIIAFLLPAKTAGAVEALETIDGEEVYWGVEVTPTEDDLFFHQADDDEIIATATAAVATPTAVRRAAPPMTRGIAAMVAASEARVAPPSAARRTGVSPYRAAAVAYLHAAQEANLDGDVSAALLAVPTAEFGSPINPQRMTAHEARFLLAMAGQTAPADLTDATMIPIETIFARPNPALEWYLDVADPIDPAAPAPAQCGCGGCPRTASSVRMCAFLARLRARHLTAAHCARRSALRGVRTPFGRRLP